MSRRNTVYSGCSAAGMLILILDSKTALQGAAEGLNLCLVTLIPSLFPFILLSVLLTSSLAGQAISMLRPLTALCKIPEGTESVLLSGILGGYPVGAQNVALLYRCGKLSLGQAARMLPFCNNAGPAFIFGVLGSAYSTAYMPWLIWLIQLFGALCVSILLPAPGQGKPIRTQSQPLTLPQALEQALRVMALICGWVIFMRVVIAFLDRWFLWRLSAALQTVVYGVLELSNGCIRLSQLENEGLRFLFASGFLSLGGICVTLQTASVSNGIPMRLYYSGKILHCFICTSVSCLLLPLLYPLAISNFFPAISIFAVSGVICMSFACHFEKKSGIFTTVGV